RNCLSSGDAKATSKGAVSIITLRRENQNKDRNGLTARFFIFVLGVDILRELYYISKCREQKAMIRNLRTKAKKTQKQVADRLNLTVQTVSNWESGRKHLRLDPLQMLTLCKTLNCSLEQLASEMSERQSA
ncbi:MAG: helix-turn-helix domain-containing protein, partial [Dolichospermum sp.]